MSKFLDFSSEYFVAGVFTDLYSFFFFYSCQSGWDQNGSERSRCLQQRHNEGPNTRLTPLSTQMWGYFRVRTFCYRHTTPFCNSSQILKFLLNVSPQSDVLTLRHMQRAYGDTLNYSVPKVESWWLQITYFSCYTLPTDILLISRCRDAIPYN